MTSPREVSFDQYLDMIFASPSWLDSCVNMLSVFLEDIESCRESPVQRLPDIAPSIVDQVSAVAGKAQQLEMRFRGIAEKRGSEFQTSELGAVLWWAGMASHKAAGAIEAARGRMARSAWEDAYFDIHASMYDTISALSLLAVVEQLMHRMEAEGPGRERPN